MGRKFALLWNATEMLDTESQESYGRVVVAAQAGAAGSGTSDCWCRSRCWVRCSPGANRSRLAVLFAMTGFLRRQRPDVLRLRARYRLPLVTALDAVLGSGPRAVPHLDPRGSSSVKAPRSLPIRLRLWASRAKSRGCGLCGGCRGCGRFLRTGHFFSKPLMRAITETNLAVALQAQGPPGRSRRSLSASDRHPTRLRAPRIATWA